MSERASPLASSDDVLGGAVVFRGTRVPIQTLFDYLEGGDRLDDFLEDFPSVTRQQAIDVMHLVGETLGRHARAS